MAVGGGFDFGDDGGVVGEEFDGAEEVGGSFGFDARIFAIRGKINNFGNSLYFFKFGRFKELLLQSGYGCIISGLMAENRC